MASGPEHYREAERLLTFAEDRAMEHGGEWYANVMRAAQVHATLALAAATVADRGIGPTESSGWRTLRVDDDQWREVVQ